MEQMLAFLSSIHPVSVEAQQTLAGIVKFIKVPKGGYVLKVGQVCENIYFIKKGLMRCYYLKKDEEVSAWFMRENDTLVSVDSFYDQVPSEEFIHALEDCELYYINFNELEKMFGEHTEFNINGRLLTLKYLRIWTRDLKNIRMMSAGERYDELLARDPDLIKRVSSKYIASYLDMKPETLSRSRGK